MPASAIAQATSWTIDKCYTKPELSALAGKTGVEYRAGLEPEISPGVRLDEKDPDTESPFFDKTLEWKIGRFAQMMTPGGMAALVTEHAKQAGESLDTARRAVTTERQMLWSDLRTAGIRIKVAAALRDSATGHTAKLLSDSVPDSGEPTKFCVVTIG
jgi:hypothetical protein